MVEVIPLKYGVTFKRVFSKPEIFNAFVNDVLGIQVKIDKVYTEYEYPEAVGFVNIKYDLFAEDTDKRVIIEVQHIKDEDFFDRFLYYHLMGLVEQTRSYQGYQFGRSVYTIVVLNSVPKDKSVQFSFGKMDMSIETEFGTRVNLYPHRLLFLSPRQVNDQTPPAAKAWLELFKDSLDQQLDEHAYPSEMFQEVIETIKKNTITPTELATIKDEETWSRSQAKAMEEGRQEGRQEGQKEGREQGQKEGAYLKTLEIAQKMIAQGIPNTTIGEMTGLPEDEIVKLRSTKPAKPS